MDWRAIGVVLGLLACAGCDGSAPTYHRDVAPTVMRHCAPCHDGSGLAPFRLSSFDDAYRERARIREAVVERTMPPWRASSSCAKYDGDWSLTDDQVATIAAWVDSGAREGTETSDPPGGPLTAGLSRVDLELRMPEDYAPKGGATDYRCFIAEWPRTTTQFVTGFRARPGNPALVHHAIAYVVRPEQRAIFQALDDADPGPGYDCPAGPGFVDRRVTWLGAWEPGSPGDEYPETTGFAVVPGSAIVIQMHYDTTTGGSGSDRTTFEFKLDDEVEREAEVIPWADPAWITTDDGMLIPAGERAVVHSYSADPTPLVSNGKPIVVRGVSLHMHELGTRGMLSIERSNGARECLLDIPRWDFDWQRSYLLRNPISLEPGDRLRIECQWDNSRPPLRDVRWGGGTTDEMCLGTMFITHQ